jgi:glycosyltransferase involved in cell wall biosynthesis
LRILAKAAADGRFGVSLLLMGPSLNILVALHDVVLGGDTINALELGCRFMDRGHRVTLFAVCSPGESGVEAPLLTLAAERGVSVHLFDEPSGLAGRARLVKQVADFVRTEGFDVVHAFGHRDTYYTFCGSYGLAGVPLVVNDYAMTVTSGLPRRVPLVVGTQEVRDQALAVRGGPTYVVVPPVDEHENRPGVADGDAFRRRHGIAADEILLVVVSRFVNALKGEGLRAAIEATGLIDDPAVRLVMVGGGGAHEQLQAKADEVNARLGRKVTQLPGPLLDPRPAYQAADIVIGMGHSALRGMAFAKPVVVVGEQGFALPATPDTMQHFDYHGLYGLGDGGDIAPALARHLQPLLHDPARRDELGEFGRRTIVESYGLDAAAERLEQIYAASMLQRSWRGWLSDAQHVAVSYGPAKVRRLIRRRRVLQRSAA